MNIAKKRTKFVPITTKNEKSYILPGRQKCDCAATKHELINNCINCGRIICEQEGSGPCWFCGALVCTEAENDCIKKESTKSQFTIQKLMNNSWPHQKDLTNVDCTSYNENEIDSKIAQERKERLLEFDKNSTQRTKVIDDQNDYYRSEGTSWIDPKKRDLLKKREDELRAQRFAPEHTKPMKYSLDLKSGQLLKEVQSNQAAYELFEDPNLIPNDYSFDSAMKESNIDTEFVTYIAPNSKGKNLTDSNIIKDNSRFINRIQDKELQEIRDDGMCISMHQPWASLLVRGVKRDEGRSWFSNHRGRLWIASTVKVPSLDSIEDLKKFYLKRGVDKHLFPDSYPIGCILGCVDVIDCLPEDDYKSIYPDGESDSPFIFICENPIELSLKFPIKGKHKIYKLEAHIHNAAKGGIQREL